MQIEQASRLQERGQLWVPRETYLRERARADRAEAIAVRLYRSQQARIARAAPAPQQTGEAGALLAFCVSACVMLSAAIFTLPFMVPPIA